MNDLSNPVPGNLTSNNQTGKVLRLKKETLPKDRSKAVGDIIRCFDFASIVQNVKHGIEYVVKVPLEYQPGLEAGKYSVLSGKDGRQWATLYEVLPNGKHSFVCNMPIKQESLIQGSPIHDISINMQLMAIQKQLQYLTELVKKTYETVRRIEQGQTDDRIGKLIAGKKGIETAFTLHDPEARQIALANAQQLLMEAQSQIGQTLKTKVVAFPTIPNSQIKLFWGRFTDKTYFSAMDEAFDSIQEYFQMYLWATKLLADSYYYSREETAAEKTYKDAVEFIASLDFSKVRTIQNIHPKEDFSDTLCVKASRYVLAEQVKSKETAKPFDSIELSLDSEELLEELKNGEE